MFVPQLFRDSAGDIGPSDFFRLFGVWSDGSLLVPHEAVLYQMKQTSQGFKRVEIDWGSIDTLRGVSCFDTGGPRLGVVGSFQNPRFFPNVVSPIVRVLPRNGLNTADYFHWAAADAVPIANITPALGPLEVLDVELTVTVRDPVDLRQYLTTRDVQAAVLEFDREVEALEGCPVVLPGVNQGPRVVGMLFNIVSDGGRSFGYCYPAASI